MDSDDDTFDYDSEISNRKPFPTEYQNEIESIESFYQYFIHRYKACPVFFMGSLQDACETAFNSPIVEEHRPILVYIHHDENPLNDIFSSKIIIDYLLENYIVWPCNITSKSNQNTRLMKIWKELFSTEILLQQYSMLFGIMQTSDIENSWSGKSRYQFRLLLENNELIRTETKVTRKSLLNELIIFKEESDKNEQDLSFDFATMTGLPWDIILKIAKYLTLKDSIIVFSPKILSLFLKYKTKLHLSEPSKPFIDMILKKINPKQIISLQFNSSRFWSKLELFPLRIFNHITSLILFNINIIEHVYHYEEFFPNLTYLSLYYDNEINIGHLSAIVNQLQSSIKRLEIRCTSSSYPRYFQLLLNMMPIPQTTIEYFLFDIHHFLETSPNQYYMNDESYFSLQIINLIKIMKNIRYIYLIVNKHNIENLLNIDEWTKLISNCYQLKKVTLKVVGMISQDKQLTQKILKIQNIRQTIKFRVLFL